MYIPQMTDAFLNIRVAYSPSCKIPHYLVIVCFIESNDTSSNIMCRPLPSCPPDVFLCKEGRPVPLYCVASTHILSHCYQWEVFCPHPPQYCGLSKKTPTSAQ